MKTILQLLSIIVLIPASLLASDSGTVKIFGFYNINEEDFRELALIKLRKLIDRKEIQIRTQIEEEQKRNFNAIKDRKLIYFQASNYLDENMFGYDHHSQSIIEQMQAVQRETKEKQLSTLKKLKIATMAQNRRDENLPVELTNIIREYAGIRHMMPN